MVTIVKVDDNGAILHEMKVAQGVFETSFKCLGWLLKSEVGKSVAMKPQEKEPEKVPETPDEVPDDTEDENLGDEEDDDSDDDDDESLLQKPIAEYTGEEIRKVAKLKNIDISGCKTKREAREALKKALISK